MLKAFRAIVGLFSVAVVLLLSLCVLMAVGWHVSDPADPSKVAIAVALDLFFLTLGIWALRKS